MMTQLANPAPPRTGKPRRRRLLTASEHTRDAGAPGVRASNRGVRESNSRWLTLAVLCVSVLVIVVDNTIVNVALPTMVRELGTSVSDLQWVVDAYTLVFAGLLLTFGTLGDRFGRKGALTIGLVIFGLS